MKALSGSMVLEPDASVRLLHNGPTLGIWELGILDVDHGSEILQDLTPAGPFGAFDVQHHFLYRLLTSGCLHRSHVSTSHSFLG